MGHAAIIDAFLLCRRGRKIAWAKRLEARLGLEFNPYILGTQSEDRVAGTDDFDFELGGDIRYRISPKMGATLNYNTDFAAAKRMLGR